jgi:hypothetical protein
MRPTPSYQDLLAQGWALQARLAELDPAIEALAALVHDIRSWQRRCAWIVVERNPGSAGEFRVDAGPFLRPMGVWMPRPGWQRNLAGSLERWISAVESVSRSTS